jgi:hypothetical protein
MRRGSSVLRFPDGPVPERAGAPYVMRGIELATSLVIGTDRTRAPLPRRPATTAELPGVLEQVLIPALQRAPCVVAFSGGRDSAGLLAAATHAARRHGLPLPVPATYRFDGIADADESAWQESVVSHLGLEDWVRVEVTDELDLVGPVAAPILRRFGPLWPPNSYFAGLLTPHARGGTLVTGVGGDEMLEPGRHRVARLLQGQSRPARGDLRALIAPLAPAGLRVRRGQRRLTALPWLVPDAAAAYAHALARELLEPLWWGRAVTDGWWRSRQRLAMTASIAAASGDDVTVEHPFTDPLFLSAAADALWPAGFPNRGRAMDLLFGDMLPIAVRHRSDKAAFFAPFVNRHTRAFIDSWDGTGVDQTLVDAEALQACWSADRVDARSYALLQSVWLNADDGGQAGSGVGADRRI